MPDGIADLSYRHYDGPLDPPSGRWKVIAGRTIQKAFKNRWLWILSILGSWYYLIMIAVLYFMDQSALSAAAGGRGGGVSNMAEQLYERLIWKDQFVYGLGSTQFMWMIVALIIGSGIIANDTRSNALLVYLSKPCGKLDYLVGKWVGVFVPILVAMSLPTALFFFYGAVNYRQHGFLTDDPWMAPKLLGSLLVGSFFYTSVILGFSAAFRQSRLAGSLLAGIYFISYFFTKLMEVVFQIDRTEPLVKRFAEDAAYWSVNGLINGLNKLILDTNGSPPFGVQSRQEVIPRPDMWLTGGLFVLVVGICLSLAWNRVRAVEVVK